MKLRTRAAIAGAALIAASGAAVAYAAGGNENEPPKPPDASGSRLDDGKDLLPQAKVSEKEAIAAAQTAATGELNEVDLEQRDGKLVWNVDVGARDVKVDAATGEVVASDEDD